MEKAGKKSTLARDVERPRVLLDTNVLVSAIISQGRARDLVDKSVERMKFSIVTSSSILEELKTVLRRPKFKTSEYEIERIVLAIVQTGEIASVVSDMKVVEKDPSDDKILNAAYDAKVNMIVTGDEHLLALGSFNGIRILRISEAIREL